MYDSKIPLEKWATAIYLHLFGKGVSARELARILKISYPAAWYMLHRIREGWPGPEPLRSTKGEMDQAYIGGKDRYKHADNKVGDNWREVRIAMNVTIDRETGRVAAEVIPDTKKETLFALAEKHLCPGATLYTDTDRAYANFGWQGRHEKVNHSIGEYVRDEAHTNTCESFNTKAKRVIVRTYHHISPKHAFRYLKEIAGRHNIRGMNPDEQVKYLASGMLKKELTYRDLVETEIPPKPLTHHQSKERVKVLKRSARRQPCS